LKGKRDVRAALALALVLVAAASVCGGGSSGGSSGGGAGSSAPASSAPQSDVKAGLVTDIGGLNDRGFNHLADVGLKKPPAAASSRSPR
jgi:basic membrane protein A and related proteins